MGILDYGRGVTGGRSSGQNAMSAASQMQGLQQNSINLQNMRNEQEQQQQAQQQAQLAQEQMPARLQEATDIMLGDDYNAQATYMLNNPDVAERFVGAMKFKDEGAMSERIAFDKQILSSVANPRPMLEKRIETVKARGGDTENLEATLALGSDDEIRSEVRKELNFLAPKDMQEYNKASEVNDKGLLAEFPSAVKETMWFNDQSKDVQDIHMKLKRDEKATLDEKLTYEESKEDIKTKASIKQSSEKTRVQRLKGYIDSGVESADNLIVVNRSLKLLDEIKTGGIDKVLHDAKRFFGVESANEAELSYNLGKTVLAQLKPTFGSAFTEAEGQRLENLESNLSKSGEGNVRILKNIQKTIDRATKRGLRAAIAEGDEFAANEIRSALREAEGFEGVNITEMSDEELFN